MVYQLAVKSNLQYLEQVDIQSNGTIEIRLAVDKRRVSNKILTFGLEYLHRDVCKYCFSLGYVDYSLRNTSLLLLAIRLGFEVRGAKKPYSKNALLVVAVV